MFTVLKNVDTSIDVILENGCSTAVAQKYIQLNLENHLKIKYDVLRKPRTVEI